MSTFNIINVLQEARRRRVFRVAGVYIVGAYVVLQVADLALPALGLPSEAIRYIWVGALLGFPIAIILGWLYDIDDGRVVRVVRTERDADLTLKRIDYLVISALAVLGVALVLGIASELTNKTVGTGEPRRATGNSIAVLPFDDTSIDSLASAAIALGLQDGLLTRLSKIDGLKVISRTSVERYRDSGLSVTQIGAELGVGNILEGSVQVHEGKLRVNAQLIDASTDEHRWADVYDRDLTASDIFDIQSEIVSRLVAEIDKTLSPASGEDGQVMPTQDLDAYVSYLKGKKESERFAAGSSDAAIEHFEAAIAADPEFALAYVGLADAYLMSGRESRVQFAEVQLAKAFQLNGSMGEGYVALGALRHFQGDVVAAEEAFITAIRLEPGNSRAYRRYGKLRWWQQKYAEALALMEQALELNPNSAGIYFETARLYDTFGRFPEAMTAYKRAMQLEPERYYVEVYLAALYYLGLGQVDESFYWYHKGAAKKQLPSGGEAATGIAYLEIGDPDSASVLIERGRSINPTNYWPLFVSTLHSVYIRDPEKTRSDALALLEIAPLAPGGLRHLRDLDLAEGRLDAARRRYARAHPELLEDPPRVTRDNYKSAIDFALVLQRLDSNQQADALLSGSLEVIEGLPRLGGDGYWVADVQIHALRGDIARALAALEAAITEGWRVKTWYHLDLNPNLESLRDNPEFIRLRNLVREDLARQAERVRQLKASGDIVDLTPLPGIASPDR